MKGYFIVPLENKFNSIDFKAGHTYETNVTNLYSRGAKKTPDFNRGMNSRRPRP